MGNKLKEASSDMQDSGFLKFSKKLGVILSFSPYFLDMTFGDRTSGGVLSLSARLPMRMTPEVLFILPCENFTENRSGYAADYNYTTGKKLHIHLGYHIKSFPDAK